MVVSVQLGRIKSTRELPSIVWRCKSNCDINPTDDPKHVLSAARIGLEISLINVLEVEGLDSITLLSNHLSPVQEQYQNSSLCLSSTLCVRADNALVCKTKDGKTSSIFWWSTQRARDFVSDTRIAYGQGMFDDVEHPINDRESVRDTKRQGTVQRDNQGSLHLLVSPGRI
ncbi:unnamed protein product [Fusarium graminearum]|nr:unnamed protein product [Fusarium graminearum]